MINEQVELPLGTYEFIEFLDERFPHRCIRKDEDVIEHHRYSAVREFIDELLIIKSEHQEGEYETSDDA